MLVSREREKLIQAAIYFAENTRYCGKIKLIKLLYLLDFEHFRQTGRSVTGMEYHAMRMGPVPMTLFEEWDAPSEDFARAIDIVPEPVYDYVRQRVVAKQPFDDRHFTSREMRLMQDLAIKFRDEQSRPLINFTHAELGPWQKIWDGGRGSLARIPYALAVADDDPHREAILAAASEQEGLRAASTHRH